MKRVIAILLLASAPVWAGVPGSVQSTGTYMPAGNGTTVVKSFATNTTAGNTIVAFPTWGAGTGVASCSDGTNGWTTLQTIADGGNSQSVSVAVSSNIAGGAVTVTCTVPNSDFRGMIIVESSQTVPANVSDGSAGQNTSGNTTANNVKTTSATTTQNGDLIIAFVQDTQGTSPNYTAGTINNFGGLYAPNKANGGSMAVEFATQTVAGAIGGFFTQDQTSTYDAIMVALKPYTPFVSSGTTATGTTSLSVAYPAGIVANYQILLCVSSVYSATAGTPTGFTAPANNHLTGTLASIDAFVRTADATESGNLSVSIPGATTSIGKMFLYKGGPYTTAMVNGADSSAGTAWSATAGSDPSAVNGDFYAVCSSFNDSATATNERITQTGIVQGTFSERADTSAGSGDLVTLITSDHVVGSGTSSAAPIYTMTLSGSVAGPSVFARFHPGGTPATTFPSALINNPVYW